MDSPGFSSFRELMDQWDDIKLRQENIKEMIEGNGIVFFFKKGKDIYGGGEGARVTFAKMKHPDEDLPDGWNEEADFSAINLSKAAKGSEVKSIFGIKDMDNIKVIDREVAEDKLIGEK
jgi:hypothetical protein